MVAHAADMVITIDGPSASGKGTVALRVAAELHWSYLDSGALYRLTALWAQQQHVALDNEMQLAILARTLPVVFKDNQVWLNNINVSNDIRAEAIGMGASVVAKLPQVREALLHRQRCFLSSRGLVTDGRDMGSVVFPKALLKIFLTASVEVRAKRRAKQLGISFDCADFKRIWADIEARDVADSNREIAPLRPPVDAKILDTTSLSIDESVKKVIDWYQQIKK